MVAISAAELSPHVRALAELLARQPRIAAADGKCRIELLLENGRLVEVFKHERIGARELEEHAVELIPAESPPAS